MRAVLCNWKTATEKHLDDVTTQNSEYEKMLDGIPVWKKQVDARLTSGQAKSEDFLAHQWRPHKKIFDTRAIVKSEHELSDKSSMPRMTKKVCAIP